jgi:hypothetical protein
MLGIRDDTSNSGLNLASISACKEPIACNIKLQYKLRSKLRRKLYLKCEWDWEILPPLASEHELCGCHSAALFFGHSRWPTLKQASLACFSWRGISPWHPFCSDSWQCHEDSPEYPAKHGMCQLNKPIFICFHMYFVSLIERIV